ncbi:MAG: LacI family DNA-binding transcriptional regulator, partial [Spirochaetia bacterium]
MRVTINDIAKATGYSKTTVSFAFNDPGQISKEAREKVLAAAKELGYVPDPGARSLSSRRHGTIGLLLPQPIPLALKNPYMVRLISGLGEICNREGLSLTMLPPTRGNLLSSVKSAAVDGFVTIGLRPDTDIVQVIKHRHIPFVTIDGESDDGIPCVSINDREAARMAMDHLLEHGHRRIGVVIMADNRLPDQEEYSATGRERLAGYREALDALQIDWEDENIVKIHEECSLEGGRHAGRELVDKHPDVTGVVAMSDILAIGIVQELIKGGKRVPWDVSIVGFDDIPEASFLSPALTTVWQPAEDKGLRAGGLLVKMIQKKTVEERVEFRCRLIQRESVAAAKS